MPFKPKRTGDPVIDSNLLELEKVIAALEKLTLRDLPVVQLSLTTSDLLVRHGFQNRPEGWLLVYLSADATIYEGASVSDPQFINLRASAACTAKLIFFD